MPRGAAFGAFIEIEPSGAIVLTCPQSEMGQGVADALARILAEELDADWDRVRVRLAPAGDPFVNPTTKRQRTANSESIAINYDLLRRAGAGARALLVTAAARRLGVPIEELTAARSCVRHAASGRTVAYGELAASAAALPAPADVALKLPTDFRLIGQRIPNKLAPSKCDGSAVFGIDVRLPGMVYAVLARSPAVAATVKRVDDHAARSLPGVVDVVQIADGVAVIAQSTWQAMRAAEALEIEYDTTAAAAADTATIDKLLASAIANDTAALPGQRFGGPRYDWAANQAALAAADKQVTFDYEVPFVAHAALEPLCCTVLVEQGACEAWVPTQQPDRARDALASICGVPRERVTLHVTLLGGGFGRKWELDFVRQAAEIAVRVPGRPVKLTWTRAQDFQHDRFRSAYRARTRVGLATDGRVTAMHSRIVGIDMWAYQKRPPTPGFGDPFATSQLIHDAYGIANPYVDFVAVDLPIPVGTWRSVSASMNGFFGESAINEIAAELRRDPYELRREWLAKLPRAQAVLDLVVEKSRWREGAWLPASDVSSTARKRGSRVPRAERPRGVKFKGPARGVGMALSMGFGSFCAQVVEVAVADRRVAIERIVVAFDCGIVIDPSMLAAQIEGGVVWGLSAARDGQIAFQNGAATASNFHESSILRFAECPPIEVHLVPSDDRPSGAGEASVPPVAPALAAAIYAATGERPRRLPLIAAGWEFA